MTMDNNIKKKLIQTGAALLFVLAIGTFGYYFITQREYDVFTCFYMTVITITTIGFDEIIDLEKYSGARPFTIVLAFAGIGLLTYFVSSISAFILEGHIQQSYKKLKMEKNISKMQDHYIICGIGKHSTHLNDELISTKRESVLVELDPLRIKQVLKNYPHQIYVEGDATHDDILEKAGIKKAKGIFASTTNDNTNIVICLSARRLNPKLNIVSLCNSHSNSEKLKAAGADQFVSPNYIGGLRMASEMLRPTVTAFLDVMLLDKDKNLRFEQIDITKSQEGKMIGELKLNEFKDSLLIGLKSDNELVFKPADEYVIKAGDSLVIMTTPNDRIKIEENFSA